MKTSRALKPSRRLREGFAKASAIPTEASWRLLEGFAKAPLAPSFGNDSSDNDKPPGKHRCLEVHACNTPKSPHVFKKNLNASEPSNQSKGSGGGIGCRDKTSTGIKKSSPMESHRVRQQYNIEEKPTVTLYTYISHHVGTPTV